MAKKKRHYLDYAAATPVDPLVLRSMRPYENERFGNPGSIHKEGVEAKQVLNDARNMVAESVGVLPDEIVFTGSATESCNLALFGTVYSWKKTHPGRIPHIVVSAVEHDAVIKSALHLGNQGVRVTVLPVDKDGRVDPRSVYDVLTDDTVVLSVMYANNEIGAIEPLREIAREIRKWKKKHRGVRRDKKPSSDERYPLFHTDATQAINYLDIAVPRLGVDLLSFNAAKIYGPKGAGALVVLRGTPLDPIGIGGGQEAGRRAGTENVPLIVGLAAALRKTRQIAESESRRLSRLRDALIAGLENKIPNIIINGERKLRLPNNIHFSVPRADHEFLAILLDARGFAVSTKSACNEADAETSHVLDALAPTDPGRPRTGIRVSLGRKTAMSDIAALLRALEKIVHY